VPGAFGHHIIPSLVRFARRRPKARAYAGNGVQRARNGLEAGMKTLLRQMVRASRFDVQTYEQVEADRASTAGAVVVVLVASIAAALGSGARDPVSIVSATIALLVTWVFWVALTYFIGTHLLPEPQTRSDLGEVLRTTGFSASPGVLRILGALPGVGLFIFIGVTIWMLLTFVVAVRQALDYASSGRALAVCVLGWLLHGLLFFAFVTVAI